MRYFEAADLPAIVRVPSREYHHIARALDMGAEGLMLPMVGNVDEVRHIVNSMKYHPAGKRGVALQVAHDRYRPGTVADKFTAANKRTTLFCQIETAEGVENAEQMAAIDGVDCLWVGHFDLSVSLGIPGEFDNPKFKKAIETTVAAAKKHNKALGRLVPTVELGIELYAQGFDFVCYSGDVWILHDGAGGSDRQAARRLQAEIGGGYGRKIPRRAVRRFQEGRRLADLSRFRPRAAQGGARAWRWNSSSRRTPCAASSSKISTR